MSSFESTLAIFNSRSVFIGIQFHPQRNYQPPPMPFSPKYYTVYLAFIYFNFFYSAISCLATAVSTEASVTDKLSTVVVLSEFLFDLVILFMLVFQKRFFESFINGIQDVALQSSPIIKAHLAPYWKSAAVTAERCLTISKWIRIFWLVLEGVLGAVVRAVFLKSRELPSHYHLLFVPPDTDWGYYVNCIHQVGITCLWSILGFALFDIILIFAVFLAKMYDAIFELLNKMDELVAENSLKEWLKNYQGLFWETRKLLAQISQVFEVFLFIFEKLCFINTFIAFVIFKKDPSMVAFALSHGSYALSMLLVVYVNEIFIEKQVQIRRMLYEKDWLGMSPSERRDFLIAIMSTEKMVGLNSGGFHDLSYEWYATFLKSTYSAALVLEDIINC